MAPEGRRIGRPVPTGWIAHADPREQDCQCGETTGTRVNQGVKVTTTHVEAAQDHLGITAAGNCVAGIDDKERPRSDQVPHW